MKITEENLKKLRYSERTGKYYKGNNTYIRNEACTACGEPFLQSMSNKGTTCSPSCRRKGLHHSEETKNHLREIMKEKYSKPENHPWFGRHHTEKSIQKMRESKLGKKHTKEHNQKISDAITGENNPFYGRHHTEKTKKIIGMKNKEENNGFWKGGYSKNNIPMYDTYATQLEWCEEIRRSPTDGNILEVRCKNHKCKKWFAPTLDNTTNRIYAINNNGFGESNFYCSDECKYSCSIYHKSAETLMKEDAIRAGRLEWLELNREVQPELRKMVMERDGYQCVKCGSKGPLQCHHIYPVATDPLESADMDNCITYCIDCHKEAHQQDGCRYGQLRTCIEYK